jgi:hypothetical protein
LLWIVGAGYFFAFFDIVTISFAAPVIATQFHVSMAACGFTVRPSWRLYRDADRAGVAPAAWRGPAPRMRADLGPGGARADLDEIAEVMDHP